MEKRHVAERFYNKFGFRSARRYAARASFVFQDIDLSGKEVCDVGCGRGAFSIWAAANGASVVGIEPQAAGSSNAVYNALAESVRDAGLADKIRIECSTLEEFSQKSTIQFDVMVLYNVINHIDESAVQRLHFDSEARSKYADLFKLLRTLIAPGGVLILADCGRSNFWNRIGLRAPLAPTIEWEKHQDPRVWIQLATQCGFGMAHLRWSYLYPFRHFTSNRLVQYITSSHFVLRLTAI